jgi:DNA repair exonuclease SbcCD ATPase subunit
MLEVILVNFRCHRNQSYRFSPGLNLIDGTSGNGKSTILEAIHFCLIGKARNVCTRGEKKCSVTLLWNGFTIQRTRGPSRLTIQPLGLEDDAAQEYLYQLIGGQNFELTSYMIQKGTSQFFTLPSADKRKFIESLSQQKIQVESLKDNINATLKTKRNQSLQHESTLTLLKKQAITLPAEPPSYGLRYLSDMERTSLFTQQTLSHYKSQLSWVEKTLQEYTHLLTRQSSLSDYRNKLDTQRVMLEQQHAVLLSDIEQLQYQPDRLEQLSRQISEHEAYLIYQKKKEEMQEKKRTYEQLVQQEESEHRKKLTELESHIKSVSQEEIAGVKQRYDKADQYKKIYKKIRDLETRRSALTITDLTALDSDIQSRKAFLQDVEQRKHVHSCPSCAGPLIIQAGTIIKATVTPITEEDQKRVKEYKISLPKLEKDRDECYKNNVLAEQLDQERKLLSAPISELENEEQYKVLRKQLEEFQTILQQNKLWETQLADLKKVVPKDKYAMIRKQFDTGIQQLSLLKKGEKSEEYDSSKQLYQSLSEKSGKWKELNRSLHDTADRLARCITEQETSSSPTVDYSEKINELSSEKSSLQEKVESQVDLLQGIQTYRSYAVQYLAEKKRKAHVQWLTDQLSRLHSEMQSVELFLRRITEAENRCLEETIELINQKIKNYLDRFFTADPMIMTLVTEKETKKGTSKPDLDVHLTYKESVCDLMSLSGGEYDRCALAFMLAINELSSSPFLILDESISSLDLASSENVLDVLKDSEPTKIVLLVSHQANTGMFDHVISV